MLQRASSNLQAQQRRQRGATRGLARRSGLRTLFRVAALVVIASIRMRPCLSQAELSLISSLYLSRGPPSSIRHVIELMQEGGVSLMDHEVVRIFGDRPELVVPLCRIIQLFSAEKRSLLRRSKRDVFNEFVASSKPSEITSLLSEFGIGAEHVDELIRDRSKKANEDMRDRVPQEAHDWWNFSEAGSWWDNNRYWGEISQKVPHSSNSARKKSFDTAYSLGADTITSQLRKKISFSGRDGLREIDRENSMSRSDDTEHDQRVSALDLLSRWQTGGLSSRVGIGYTPLSEASADEALANMWSRAADNSVSKRAQHSASPTLPEAARAPSAVSTVRALRSNQRTTTVQGKATGESDSSFVRRMLADIQRRSSATPSLTPAADDGFRVPILTPGSCINPRLPPLRSTEKVFGSDKEQRDRVADKRPPFAVDTTIHTSVQDQRPMRLITSAPPRKARPCPMANVDYVHRKPFDTGLSRPASATCVSQHTTRPRSTSPKAEPHLARWLFGGEFQASN